MFARGQDKRKEISKVRWREAEGWRIKPDPECSHAKVAQPPALTVASSFHPAALATDRAARRGTANMWKQHPAEIFFRPERN